MKIKYLALSLAAIFSTAACALSACDTVSENEPVAVLDTQDSTSSQEEVTAAVE